MSFISSLFESQVITDKILQFLDAKSLAYFGSTSQKWRDLSNSDIFWLVLLSKFKFNAYFSTKNTFLL